MSALAFGFAPCGAVTDNLAFAGGSVDALASAISKAMKAPVVIETSKTLVEEPLTLNTSSLGSLGASFRKSNLALQPGTDIVLSDQAYVRANFSALLGAPFPPTTSRLGPGSLKGGLLSVDTSKSGPISVGSLEDLHWHRPFKVNFLLQKLALSIVAKDIPEVKFLDMVRKAVGGQWIDVNGTLTLFPDPVQFRTRAQNTFVNSDPTKDAVVTSRRILFLVAAQNFNDSDLAILLSAQNGSATEAIVPGSTTAQAALNFLDLKSQQEAKTSRNRASATATALSQIDNRRSVTIKLTATGAIQLIIPTYNRATRKTATVSIS